MLMDESMYNVWVQYDKWTIILRNKFNLFKKIEWITAFYLRKKYHIKYPAIAKSNPKQAPGYHSGT